MKEQNTNKFPFGKNKSNDELRRNPFIVPNGYFDNLPNQIRSEISLREKHSVEQNSFSVPDGYFDQLTQDIKTQITVKDLKEKISEDGFTVPKNYFDTLRNHTLDKIHAKPKKTIYLKKWVNYASVACLLIAMSVGGGYFWKSQSEQEFSNTESLSKIPDDEIINYLAQSVEEEDVLYLSQYFGVDHSDHDHSPGIGCHAREEDLEDYINYSL